MSLAILVLSLIILGVQVARLFLGDGSGDMTADLVNAFMFAVAVAVAAIPEALNRSLRLFYRSVPNKWLVNMRSFVSCRQLKH